MQNLASLVGSQWVQRAGHPPVPPLPPAGGPQLCLQSPDSSLQLVWSEFPAAQLKEPEEPGEEGSRGGGPPSSLWPRWNAKPALRPLNPPPEFPPLGHVAFCRRCLSLSSALSSTASLQPSPGSSSESSAHGPVQPHRPRAWALQPEETRGRL